MTLADPAETKTLTVNLRPVVLPDDEAFLLQLYFTVRDDLSGMFDDEAQQRQLLLMQYSGQTKTYAQEYPNATHELVMLGSDPVGRLIVDRRPDSIHGVDLAILPEYRNLGVGGKVVANLIKESSERGVPFTLSVVKTNPAIRLYERLGLRIDGDHATHFSMSVESE